MTNEEYFTIEYEDLQIAVLLNCADYKKTQEINWVSVVKKAI